MDNISPRHKIRQLCQTRPQRFNDLLAFIGGVIYALGFPTFFPHSLFFLPMIGALLYLYTLHPTWIGNKNNQHESRRGDNNTSFKTQLKSTYLFLLGANLVAYYWIAHTVKEFGDIPFPLNFVPCLLFSLICLPQYWGFPIILWIRTKYFFHWKLSLGVQHLLFAIFIVIFENTIPQQFASSIAHPYFYLTPNLGLAPIGGLPLFSFLTFYFLFAIYSVIAYRKWDLLAFSSYALFMILNFAFPLTPTPSEGTHKMGIRLVQANVGNFLKLSSEAGDQPSVDEVISRYKTMSMRPNAFPLDLIIWPETAYPYMFSNITNETRVPEVMREVQAQTHAEMIFGGYLENSTPKYRDWDFEQVYNAAFFINPQGKMSNTYLKQILLPFGETLPFSQTVNHTLGQYLRNISYFASGNEWKTFTTSKGIKLLPTICYELISSSDIRKALNQYKDQEQPHILVNLTNDSWFGDTSEPELHLMLSRWRSLEFQIPIIRSTNTGITTIIDRDGKEINRIAMQQIETLDHLLSVSDRKPSLYQKWGMGITFALWSLLLFFAFIFEKRVILHGLGRVSE